MVTCTQCQAAVEPYTHGRRPMPPDWCRRCRRRAKALRYSRSEAGKATVERHLQTEKFRATRKRYTKSPKYRARVKRYMGMRRAAARRLSTEPLSPGMAPLCTACFLRPARPHFAVGFWKLCEKCRLRKVQTERRPGRCICGMPARVGSRWCSQECSNRYATLRLRKIKDKVLAALGGQCACMELNCTHSGTCTVRLPDALTVHHDNGDGGAIRTSQGGRRQQAGGVSTWSRYGRALVLPDHGMRLLCHNCHHVYHYRLKRARYV